MDTEQLRQNAAAMIAFADGKKVQLRYTGEPGHEWTDSGSPKFEFHAYEYRPKPEPVSRPWSKSEDVPGPVCWLRMSADGYLSSHQLITFISRDGVLIGGSRMIWSQLSGYEHSTDRLEWKPCVVTEEAK